MSIPPFPSQDLAKLVLGYLAEEQLMTAYDEFLQASPYLDALRNEYDRIFMTSLKSILAEYRAVKIYVDTCKPFALRKKIFQCTSLLEVVKFLIANVDIKKIQLQEAPEKASLEKQSITATPKSNTLCELCHSLSLPGCVCKNRPDVPKPEVYASYVETSSLQNSVETTPLADLPGNHVTTRKKHGKVLEKDVVPLHSNVSSLQSSDSSARQSLSTTISPEEYLARCENSPVAKSTDSTMTLDSTAKPIDPLKSNQNIEEFDNVLKSVVNRNKTLSGSECSSNQRISNAGTFQDFASGVSGGDRHSATYNLPDSSTSENSNVRAPLRKDVYNDNIKGPPQCQLLLQVSRVNDVIDIQTCKTAKLPKLLPKTTENQIKIISDIKVDNKLGEKLNSNNKKPLVPINATSTPLMQMQTIMINGTPAYKHTPNTRTFTKDEIMAMPTLIVVPASGQSQVPTSVHCNPITTPNTNVTLEATSPQILGPLVIDVPSNTAISNKQTMEALPDLSEQKPMIGDLVKTVDIKNSNGTTASVPKDNVISMESNTPQVLPPMRKSSSTPRRTSHVRVLDFTTPRRILHETINEQVPSQSSDPQVDIVVSGSENTASAPPSEPEAIDIKNNIVVVLTEEGNNDTGSAKENEAAHKKKPAKKYDWDADLRALVANEKPINISHRKPKHKASKKKKSSDKNHASKDSETKKKSRSKQSPRVKRATSRIVDELDDESPPDTEKTCDVPCKPTVKIICGDKVTGLQESKADSSNKNKSLEKTDEYVDTPETERLSLQNVIGAKLNISDFLETPYKQALYDIQMETPRFLGPDLPDEPLSDIKIMNIPTPRFLNTPNLAQATPSYASRPTDYSSGGSYYKPDDQDYMPIPDLTTCPVTSSKEDINVEKSTENDNEQKKSRPVRKCAKNVSYYKSSGAVKKDAEDNIDAISSCSEKSAKNSFEFRSKNETTSVRTPRAKAQSTSRTDSRSKTSTSKKKKSQKDSVVKDKSKSFMKIKPKYTPKKGTPAKNGKKMVQSPLSRGYPSVPQRKRTTSKDRLVNVTSLIAPAATKSRRKSSTPRKLQCTKTFNTQIYSDDTPDNISNTTPNVNCGEISRNTLDSDTEQIALRWSDEGSEDAKPKDVPTKTISKETECITQIQEFIVSTGVNNSSRINTTQRDLMIRGFDLETAKIIERDLMDDTPVSNEASKSRTIPISVEIVENKKDDSPMDKTAESSSHELQIAQDESDDEIELTAYECDEESNNYFVFKHDYTKEVSQETPIKIKDNFTMEICIDDVTMRLKAPPFKLVLDQDPLTVDEIDYSYQETEQAVKSISGMDRLYTPLKDSFKSQCYAIFDSTLTSIDTPLKSPVRNTSDATVTELVLEGKKTEPKDDTEKKRKRARSSSNDSGNSNKRTKPDADLLLKAANIQNIDIETVLTKLHGH